MRSLPGCSSGGKASIGRDLDAEVLSDLDRLAFGDDGGIDHDIKFFISTLGQLDDGSRLKAKNFLQLGGLGGNPNRYRDG